MRSFFFRKTLPVAVIFLFRSTAPALQINLAVLLCGLFKFTLHAEQLQQFTNS